MGNEPVVTAEGMHALEEKLKNLETTKRREISKQMKDAIAHGDLSDNAQYDEAREAYLKLEKDINETAGLIARSRVIGDSEISTEKVGVGSLVQIEDVENGSTVQEYRLVGPTETDLDNGKISHLCPIGLALMNAKLNDVVNVNTPGGARKYKVITISR